MDRATFYSVVRKDRNINLTERNVYGHEKLLTYSEQNRIPTNDVAYCLATAYWETGGTMHPVVEAFYIAPNDFNKAEQWRKKNLRYYPWHGRGLVQTTWERNYREVGKLLGLGEGFFTSNPDKLLEWQYSIPALFKAMDAGLYTGKSINDYIDEIDESDEEDRREFVNARRIVNGTDQAGKIADLALTYEDALRAAGYLTSEPEPQRPVQPDIPVPTPKPTGNKGKVAGGIVALIIGLLTVFWEKVESIWSAVWPF